MDAFKISDHIMRDIETLVFNVNMNRRRGENDSDMLDRVQDALNRRVIDYQRLKGLDTTEQEEAYKHAIEKRNRRY